MRSNLALAQKRFVSEIDAADIDEPEEDLMKMTAQVVSEACNACIVAFSVRLLNSACFRLIFIRTRLL